MSSSVKKFEDWEPYRDEIAELYFDKKRTLNEVQQHMEKKHGFRATQRQYKYLLNKKNSGRSKYKSRRGSSRCHDGDQKLCLSSKGSNAQVSLPNKKDEDSASLDVPSELLSRHDYGSIQVLIRQTLLQGIPEPGRDIMGFIEDPSFPLSSQPRSPPTLGNLEQYGSPRSLSYLWNFESLISILASENLEPVRRKIPGFPNNTNDLQCCSRADLLNMAVSVIINGLSAFCYDLIAWFTDDHQNELLARLLNIKSDRLLSFTFNLITAIGIREFLAHKENDRQYQLQYSSKATHAARLGFLALAQEIKGQYSRFNFSKLLHTIGSLDLPDIVEQLLQATSIKDSDALHFAFYSEKWEVAKILWSHGHHLQKLIDRLWFTGHPRDIRRVAQLFEIFLSQLQIHDEDKGAFDRSVDGTDPFTLGETISLYSTSLAVMLEPWILDPLSIRICQGLSISSDTQSCLSNEADELRLLMAVRLNDEDLVRVLLQSGVNPNCPNLHVPDGMMSSSELSLLNKLKNRSKIAFLNRSFITLEDDLIQSLPYFPLTWALVRHNVATSTLLLNFNAHLSEEMLGIVFEWVLEEYNFVRTLLPILLQPHLMRLYTKHHRLGLAILSDDLNILADMDLSNMDIHSPISISYQRTPVTIFTFALAFCRLQVVEFLWDKTDHKFIHEQPNSGAFEMTQLLSTASRHLFPELKSKMCFLLRQGACLNRPCDINGFCETDNTPLQELLSQPHMDNSNGILKIVEFLVLKGADVNASLSTGPTPLQLAASHRRFDVVKRLVELNADVDLVRGLSEMGDPVLSVLGHACLACNFDMIRFLVDNGANVNVRSTHHNNTPLHHACSVLSPSIKIVRYLIEHGADVNAASTRHTVLQDACQNGFFHAVLLLLEKGANIDAACGPEGLGTAIEIAAFRGHFDVVRLLVNAGAERNITENRFARAIRLAGSQVHVVEYLEGVRFKHSDIL